MWRLPAAPKNSVILSFSKSVHFRDAFSLTPLECVGGKSASGCKFKILGYIKMIMNANGNEICSYLSQRLLPNFFPQLIGQLFTWYILQKKLESHKVNVFSHGFDLTL